MKKHFYFTLLIVAALIGSFSAQTTFTINTFAGTGASGSAGDGGLATAATFNYPHGVAVDASGNVYVSELSGHKIRKINTSGIISTFAGTGVAASGGDGGLATAAQLNQPAGLAIDAAGNVYVTEFGGHRVRKINTSGIISTVAGNGVASFSGDGGLATAASINLPIDVQVDVLGNIYITDSQSHRIRMVNTSGIINTIVGNGTASSTGDGGLANAATINYPSYIFLDGTDMYISELTGNCVRKVNSSGIISTIVGNGTASSSGDGGLATAATLNAAGTIVRDAAGNLLISEYSGNRIRSINSGGIISTVVGTGIGGFSGDGGLATSAQINGPFQMAKGLSNEIYVAEYLNNRVRVLTSTSCTTAVTSSVSSSPALCNGAANGSATVIAVGGSGFTYTWMPSGGNAAVASGLTAGSYTAMVKNSCGSLSFNAVNIAQPTPMITTIFGNPVGVCSGATSTLTTLASGGTPGYTYSWTPSGGAGSTVAVSTSVTTIYTATATDANLCTKTNTIQITVNTPTVTAVTSASVLCAGQSATLTAGGANTYLWSTTATNTTIVVSPTVTTSYTVAGTSAGCTAGAVITQSVSTCIGISEQSASNIGLALYPNPNNGEFTIVNSDLSSDMHFEVYNTIGQLILKDVISEAETKVALKNANNGIYFVKLMNGAKVVKVQKMVKE